MSARVRIRGSYATALTSLLLEWGYVISDPSPELGRQLGLKEGKGPHEVSLGDRENRQGIEARGESERVCELVRFLQDRLGDAVLLGLEPWEEADGWVKARLEFPGEAKRILDRIRDHVIPTLARHHRLCIVNPRALERAERELREHPERRAVLEGALYRQEILVPVGDATAVIIEHVKVSGRRVRPREAHLVGSREGCLTLRRALSPGRYDGLDLPIEQGDYAVTEIQEGAWSVTHRYYAGSGVLKGEFHNVNTPVELYPHGARYVDLELDVVRRAGEDAFLVDQERLEILCRQGFIGPLLGRRARQVAGEILARLQGA